MNPQNAISAGHEKTLEVAKQILQNGGNAFDASIAAGFAMFITEPCMASAGAGGFAMCLKNGGRPVMLDFFTQTPRKKPKLENRDFYPIDVNFGIEVETFHVGLAAAAVPGTIAGLYAMHRKFASMPMNVLLEPAMDLARKGVVLNTFQSIDLELLEVIFRVDPSVKDVFFKGDERKKEGDLLHLPHFADFLTFLKYEGETGFYHGEIGRKISEDCKERGGYLRRDDFENYEAKWRSPLALPWKGKQLYLPNGPSLGGALLALILEYLDLHQGDWIRTIDHVKRQYKDGLQIAERLHSMYPELDFRAEGEQLSSKGTTHFNVADKWGNAVSLTTSLGEGCGYFIPGTDMQLNNMMGESFLLPNGFHSWKENVRLNSMMTPTLMLDNSNNLVYAGGSGGAGRIPFMIAQVLQALFAEKKTLLEATCKPRVHVHDHMLHYEKGASFDQNGFEHLKEWDYRSLFFGGVHSIFRDAKGALSAEGDARRYGVSEVF